MAQQRLRRDSAAGSIQPTQLVHEMYLRLIAHRNHDWQNRAHFFGAVARLMRRILVDHARANAASKRGRGRVGVTLDESAFAR